MARERKGTTIERDGKIYARVTYAGADGKRHAIWRKAENRTHARELRKKILRELETQGEQALDADRMTFEQLAHTFEERRVQPPQYQGDRKVAGMRSWRRQRGFLKVLTGYFGKKRIKTIQHHDIEQYKMLRLKTKTRRDAERSIANVNRELSLLRAIFNFAKRTGWLAISPFERGETLISTADEVRRERILTPDEEDKLLAACVDRRAHLKPVIYLALDTAMRKGEILSLKWGDVDFENRVIRLRAFTTKTARSRIVGMTARVHDELKLLWEFSEQDVEALVFGLNDVKTSFASACRKAEIVDFRFHDLRHSAVTRLVQAGMPVGEVMKISGHSTPQMLWRYLNADEETARRAATKLDALRIETTQKETSAGLIN